MNNYTANANQSKPYVPEGFTQIQGENPSTGERSPRLKIEPGQSFLGVILRRQLNKQSKFGVSDLYWLKPVVDYKPEAGICVYGETDVFFGIDSQMLRERLSGIPDNSLVCIVNSGKPNGKNYFKWEVFVDTRYKPVAATTSAIPQAHHFAQPQYNQPVQYSQPVVPQTGQVMQNPNVMSGMQQAVNPVQNATQYGANEYSIPSSQEDDLPF